MEQLQRNRQSPEDVVLDFRTALALKGMSGRALAQGTPEVPPKSILIVVCGCVTLVCESTTPLYNLFRRCVAWRSGDRSVRERRAARVG